MQTIIFTILMFSMATALGADIVVWPHPYLKPMQWEATQPDDAGGTIKLQVTPGEYEPAVFAVRSDNNTAVTVALKTTDGVGMLPESWCTISRVGSLNDDSHPDRLYEAGGEIDLEAKRTQYFWITVRPPQNTPAGIYKSTLEVKAGSGRNNLELACEVLSFRLEPSTVTGGVFMASTDIPESWYADMKDHGINAIQFFWSGTGIKINREGDGIKLDFNRMDKMMGKVNAAKLDGPVVISLGNDRNLMYELEIGALFDMPVVKGPPIEKKQATGPAITPKLDSLFVDGMRQIRTHWESMGWPQELVVLIYDEPTERLLDRSKSRYDLLKIAMPDYRVYGVVMNRGDWAASMADQCDIIVSDGDFLGCLDAAVKFDKDYWVYSFPMRNVHTMRYDMGCLPWRVQAQGAFFWMYNYWNYNPKGCAVYAHPDDKTKLVPSTGWEGAREGMDDLRYFATAERMIDRAPVYVQPEARSRLFKIRSSIDPNRRKGTPTGEDHDELSILDHYSEPQKVREQVIELIQDLLFAPPESWRRESLLDDTK